MPSIPNPVLPGFYPDPSVCRVGSDYYMVTSTFEYFPGVPVFHSTDLFSWRQIGHCLTRRSQLDLAGRRSSDGIFAPTLRYHNGIFYMVTTDVGGAGHFFVTTDNPAGPWSDPVYVEGPGFDPDLFFDDDGTVYFSREDITGYGIRQFEIDIQTGALVGPERIIWDGLEDRLCEAPHIYKIGKWYYLLVAEGGTHRGHMIVVARGTSAKGPFESCPQNPILTHRHRVMSEVQATGHGDLIQKADGSWWMLFLGIRPVGKWHHLGRETFIAPVRWVDGWPVVNDGEAITLSTPENHRSRCSIGITDGSELGMEWNARGFFDPERITIRPESDSLRLVPNTQGLSQATAPSFVGRRQTAFNTRISARFDVSRLQDGDEAGLAVIMNEQHYYAITCICRVGNLEIALRRQLGELSVLSEGIPLAAAHDEHPRRIVFMISSDRERYHFSFEQADGSMNTIGNGECRYLSTEVAGGFTGVYLGPYAGHYGSEDGNSLRGFAVVSELTYETMD